MDVNFLTSPRTIFTAGGDGYTVRRQAKGLASVNGYNLRGSVQRRVSKTQTIGATFQHTHFDFPPAFGEADMNIAEGFYSTSLGRRWTFSIHGGISDVDTQGLEVVALDPVLAALLGQSNAIRAFQRSAIYPSGSATLSGSFKTYNLSLSYARLITPGNGVYLTSRSDAAFLSYSYTGIRKWNFALNGGYNTLASVGQGIKPYASYAAGAGITYGLTRSLHVIARYDLRQQQIDSYDFRRTGYRASLGLAFSPGDKPLSLW
jgi:hypothetical protein